MTQIVDDVQAVLAKLHAHQWWQGSIIHHSEIADLVIAHGECEWWILASQACNIYSDNFDTVPVVELIGATAIAEVEELSSGSHPREIHLAAYQGTDELCLKAESQKRVWIPRIRLTDLPAPSFKLENRHTQPFSNQNLWLDKFSSWLSRGYTRVALPDAFNTILGRSKIRDVLEAKLAKKRYEEIFGIFLTITAEQEHAGLEIGLLTPPYDLGILVACYESVDPDTIHTQLLKQLFTDKIKDPEVENTPITRCELARRLGIRILQADVEVRPVSDIYLIELLGKNKIRYNLMDFLSSTESTEI